MDWYIHEQIAFRLDELNAILPCDNDGKYIIYFNPKSGQVFSLNFDSLEELDKFYKDLLERIKGMKNGL